MFSGTATVALFDVFKAFAYPLLVPRTREGYYHYTGGIEVLYHSYTSAFPTVHRQQLNGLLPLHHTQIYSGWKRKLLMLNKLGILPGKSAKSFPESAHYFVLQFVSH